MPFSPYSLPTRRLPQSSAGQLTVADLLRPRILEHLVQAAGRSAGVLDVDIVKWKKKTRRRLKRQIRSIQSVISQSGGERNLSLTDLLGFGVTERTIRGSAGQERIVAGLEQASEKLEDPNYADRVISSERAARTRRQNAAMEQRRREYFQQT